ncbi:transmembrane protein 231-like protein, partial [Dinothrombium tinctorium]
MLCSLFSQPTRIVHKSTFYSKATAFHIICFILNVTLPLIIIYKSDGLWKKEEVFTEQPEISFAYNLILMLDTDDPIGNIVWTSLPQLNLAIDPKIIRAPIIENYEMDVNMDGKKDLFKLYLLMPLNESENVVGVKAIFVFDYKIKKIDFKMDAI